MLFNVWCCIESLLHIHRSKFFSDIHVDNREVEEHHLIVNIDGGQVSDDVFIFDCVFIISLLGLGYIEWCIWNLHP